MTVTDGTRPLAGAFVLLYKEPVSRDLLLNHLSPVRTDSDGRATVGELLAGKYRVAAYPSGAAWANDPLLQQRLADAQEITIGTNSTVVCEVRAIVP